MGSCISKSKSSDMSASVSVSVSASTLSSMANPHPNNHILKRVIPIDKNDIGKGNADAIKKLAI